MSKLTRTLIIGAMLAAMHLAATTAAAHAHAIDQQTSPRPPAEGKVGESWRHRQATAPQQETAADAVRKRVEARERFSIPNPSPAQAPAPAPPKQSGQPGWLVAWLGGLAAVLAGGLGVHAARRTRRRARLEHAA